MFPNFAAGSGSIMSPATCRPARPSGLLGSRNVRVEPRRGGILHPGQQSDPVGEIVGGKQKQVEEDDRVPTNTRTNNAIGIARIGCFSETKPFSSSLGVTVQDHAENPHQRGRPWQRQRKQHATQPSSDRQRRGRQRGTTLTPSLPAHGRPATSCCVPAEYQPARPLRR